MDPLAHQFDRYRRYADLDALAAVFDATAPKMLRIALHLAGDPHDAEDLLQQAFLVAIERAESIDARQPLTPWLLGIVRQLARGGRRRREVEALESSAEPVVEDATPDRDAEAAELRSLLQRHIERLASEQRQVLLLQLRYGLEPAEIAQVLELAPSTVRMRLKRGRDALRRLLPAGVGAVVALGVGGSTLAAVRARTLAVAGQVVRPVAWGGLGGGVALGGVGFAMKNWLVVAGAVLVSVFAGVWWSGGLFSGAQEVAPRGVVAEAQSTDGGKRAGQDPGQSVAAHVDSSERGAEPGRDAAAGPRRVMPSAAPLETPAELVPPTDIVGFVGWQLERSGGFARTVLKSPNYSVEDALRDRKLNPEGKVPSEVQRERLQRLIADHRTAIEPVERDLAEKLDDAIVSSAARGNYRQIHRLDADGQPVPGASTKVLEFQKELHDTYGAFGRDHWRVTFGGRADGEALFVYTHRGHSPEVFSASDRLQLLYSDRSSALWDFIRGM